MSSSSATEFVNETVDPAIRGFLHTPDTPTGDVLVLSHGAGGNAQAPLLRALADAFCQARHHCASLQSAISTTASFRPARPRRRRPRSRRPEERDCRNGLCEWGCPSSRLSCEKWESRRFRLQTPNLPRRPFLRRTPIQHALCRRARFSRRPAAALLSAPSPAKARTAAHAAPPRPAHPNTIRSGHARSLRLNPRTAASVKDDPRKNKAPSSRRSRSRSRI